MSAGAVLLFAVLLDHILGEPRRWHPLVGFGRLANWVEGTLRRNQGNSASALNLRIRGVLGIIALLAPLCLLALWLATLFGPIFDIVVVYLAIGATSLAAHARLVYRALQQHDTALARANVAMLVSRDTQSMQETDVAKATIESVLENGNDAVFGALFWYLLLGVPGVVLYRLSNTLDAMWGYRNQHYLYFGWAAARLDDLLNWIPARLTALTYTLLGSSRLAWRCWHNQARSWYSPNAGPVMAAGAGALGIELGGPASYHGEIKHRPILGMGRTPTAPDIERAVGLVRHGLWLWVLVTLLGSWINA